MREKKNGILSIFEICGIQKYFAVIVILLVTIECVSTLGLAFYESKAIDTIAYESFEKKFLIKLVIGIVLFVVMQWLCSVYVPYIYKITFIKRSVKIRNHMFRSIIDSSVSNINKLGNGDITVKLTVDISKIEKFVMDDMYIIVKRTVMALGSLLLAIYFNWKLAILEFIMLPFIVKMNMKMNDSMDENYYLIEEYYGKMSNLFISILRSLKLIKANCVELFFEKKLNEALMKVQNESIHNNKKITKISNKLICVNQIPTIIHFTVGTVFIYYGFITLGEFVVFGVLRGYITNFLMYIPTFIPKYNMAKASVKRINDVFDMEAEEDYVQVQKISNDTLIEVRKVGYSYQEKLVLKNVSINVKKRKINVLVGKSGGGKTTLLLVLGSIFKPQQGSVIYNENIIKFSNIRKNIAYVSQQPYIFPGTIMQNININNKCTLSEVINICKKLNIHDAIMSFEKQYETMLGEDVVQRLSGGQLQRICIARAYLKNSEIIIMDEPTSALDTENEDEVVNILKEIKNDRTILISSHSVPVMKCADYLYSIEDGQVELVENVNDYINSVKQYGC